MSLDIHFRATKCPHCGGEVEHPTTLYQSNMTHNLGKMAAEAGIYDCLWRPDENGINRASELIPLLEQGLSQLRSRPDYFKQFDSDNGWGTYDQFVPWVEEVLLNAKEYPSATVDVYR